MQHKIERLKKLYKNRKIVIYGDASKYNLAGLNIVGTVGKDISPEELGTFECNLILIADEDYQSALNKLDDHILYMTPNESIEIRPLIKRTFWDFLD